MDDLILTDDERAELTVYALESLKDYQVTNAEDAWYGIVLRCTGRTFDVNLYGGSSYDLTGMVKAVVYGVDDKGSTITNSFHVLLVMPDINTEGKSKFNVNFTLTRCNSMRTDDETLFDTQQIANEIESWLSDLDFQFDGRPQVQQVNNA